MAVSKERVEAYTLIEGSINQIIFANFIKKLISAVKFRTRNPRTNIIILLDNLFLHKTFLVKCVVLEAGVRLLFNAPYSPEINYIENIFRRLKRMLNKYQPRTNM